MIVFFEVFIALVVIVGVIGLFAWAIDSTMGEYGWRVIAMRFAVTFAVTASIVAVVASLRSDEHANQLCLSGHEVWATVHSRYGDTLEKQWVCTQWEQ